jgi:hypothetical protein
LNGKERKKKLDSKKNLNRWAEKIIVGLFTNVPKRKEEKNIFIIILK